MTWRGNIEHWLGRQWQKRGLWAFLMRPLSKIFGVLAHRQRQQLQTKYVQNVSPVPLIIVGNLTVGGAGKTPVVLALAQVLKQAGYFPGIISRGYGAHIKAPLPVFLDSSPHIAGDEPVLMARRLHALNIPIWVYHRRFETLMALLTQHPETNVIISDDGLQHYALQRVLPRDIELVVMDERGGGNGDLLPAGPLRENLNRERTATIWQGLDVSQLNTLQKQNKAAFYEAHWQMNQAWQINYPNQACDLSAFVGRRILAAAGIGYPVRFFKSLTQAGLMLSRTLSLPDHFDFVENPFKTAPEDLILVTEKDAVKCAKFNDPRLWAVSGHLVLPTELFDLIQHSIEFIGPLYFPLSKGITHGSALA